MSGRVFPLAVVLSCSTGRLVCSPFSLVHEALDFLTDDQLFTHQLPRAFDAVQPVLHERHPELASVDVARLDALLVGTTRETAIAACTRWVSEMAVALGRDSYELEPVGAFERRNPIAEAVEMMGGDASRVVAVVAPSRGEAER